jgi:hypothetical protein
MKAELLRPVHTPVAADDSAILLLETLLTLTGDGSPWAVTVMDHLLQNKLFHLLRGILLEVVFLLPVSSYRSLNNGMTCLLNGNSLCSSSAVLLWTATSRQRKYSWSEKLLGVCSVLSGQKIPSKTASRDQFTSPMGFRFSVAINPTVMAMLSVSKAGNCVSGAHHMVTTCATIQLFYMMKSGTPFFCKDHNRNAILQTFTNF